MNDQTSKLEAELQAGRTSLRDNVEELTDRLNPSRLMHDVTHAAATAPKKVATGVGSYVRDHPVPTVLAGIGLYLLLNGARSSRRREEDRFIGYDDGWPSEAELEANSAWESYQEASWACVRGAGEAEDEYERRLFTDRGRSLGIDRVGDEDHKNFKARVERAADKTRGFAMNARDKIKRAAQSGARNIGGAASKATHAVKSGAAAASHAAGSARHRAEDLYDERPLTAGAVGLAAGAVIGALLPLSRMEMERLQGMVDDGLSRGAESARNAASAVTTFADDISSTQRH